MTSFHEEFRFGSARWACEQEVRRFGLFNPVGPHIGFFNRRPLRLNSDAPMITIGGAGSGKGRDLLTYNVCGYRLPDGRWYAPPRMFVNDPRGELAAMSLHNQVRLNKRVYCINPYGLHGLPSHRVNPWDMLRPDSVTLHADIKLLIADLIPLSGSSNGEYFELRGRQWCGALVLYHVMAYGVVTMPNLYDMVNLIQGDGWGIVGRAMLDSPFGDVQRTAIEIDTKRQEAQKEFGAIMGEVAKSVDFLSDPAVSAMLNGGDFSLEVLCQHDCTVYNMIPVEYLAQLAPMNRALIGAAMLYKQRHPDAPGILFVIDEAATLGRFESLLRGYSFGRGMGIRMWTIWQDIGQISRNFGKDALSGFLGSSQLRQFFGIRDYDTAKLVSEMLGLQTLEFDQVLEQERAAVQKAQAVRRLMAGDDPIAVGLEMGYQNLAVTHRAKQARALMTPDEILAMPENRQIMFISGLTTPSLYAYKYPYYTRREMAGGYLPNPYHRPNDRVKVATLFGSFWRRVVTEPVPRQHAHLPQYQGGEWAFIKGYRPH